MPLHGALACAAFRDAPCRFYSGILADWDDTEKTFTMKPEVANALALLGIGPVGPMNANAIFIYVVYQVNRRRRSSCRWFTR